MNFGVFFGPERIGTLESTTGRLRFQYAPEYVGRVDRTISVRLPPRAEPYADDETRAYFANLLPEDEYRRLLARELGVAGRNVAGLLAAIGGECAGAVSVWPEGKAPHAQVRYERLDDSAVRELFAAGSAAERRALIREGRLSLAGGMEKIGLRRMRGAWHRGLDGAPTTHIIKWAPTAYPDLVLNEYFCLELLRAAGVAVASADVEDHGTPVLVVRRFDRNEFVEDEGIALLHQEDVCQACGRLPEQKYQVEGGPSVADCAAVLREHAQTPAREIRQLIAWVVANFLLGNADAHAKNLALVHEGGFVTIAPFYDVVCTHLYSGLKRHMAMSVGGEYRLGYVRERHWHRFASDLGVGPAAVRDTALALATRLEAVLPDVSLSTTARFGASPVVSKVERVFRRQVAALRAALE